jgi:hypothetical protein
MQELVFDRFFWQPDRAPWPPWAVQPAAALCFAQLSDILRLERPSNLYTCLLLKRGSLAGGHWH